MRQSQSIHFRRFRIFGWNIYITRNLLKLRDPKRNRPRTSSKAMRLEATDYHCELCGRHINIRCTLYHLLPVGVEGRNELRNIRVICPECHDHVHRVGGYRPMITRKGGEA